MHISSPDSRNWCHSIWDMEGFTCQRAGKGDFQAPGSILSAPKTLSIAIILLPAFFPDPVSTLTPRRSHSSCLQSPAVAHFQEGDMGTMAETNTVCRAHRQPVCSWIDSPALGLSVVMLGPAWPWAWARNRPGGIWQHA